MAQVVQILMPFLVFTMVYNETKAHNMLVIMLDPYFKNMKVIWDFLGDAPTIEIVAKGANMI
jgi:hypothetical protein